MAGSNNPARTSDFVFRLACYLLWAALAAIPTALGEPASSPAEMEVYPSPTEARRSSAIHPFARKIQWAPAFQNPLAC